MIRTLVFPGDDDRLPWLRLDAANRVTRGESIGAASPIDPETPAETVAIVPGTAVVLHWVQLPPLAPAQAAAAARLMAAEISATPIDQVHVALGPAEAEGWRAMALVDAGAMAGWLARLAAAGIDPDRMVPEQLLLPEPEAGVAVRAAADAWQVRGQRLALVAEPALAIMLVGEAAVVPVDEAAWQDGLASVLAAPLLDLRQGAFVRVRRWQPDARRLRRLALAGVALLGVLLATEMAAILRFGFAADRAELALADAARQVLPRGTVVTDPRAQVAARQAQLGGAAGFSALAAPVLAAVRSDPSVTLQSIDFAPATGLSVVMDVPAPPAQAAMIAALASEGLDAQFGAPGEAGGTPRIELRVRAR